MLMQLPGTHDGSIANNFQTPLTMLDLIFDKNTTVVLNDKLQAKTDMENVYQPSFDLISVERSAPQGGWIPTVHQKRYALDGTHLNADVEIPILELAGVQCRIWIDHMWHFTPVVKKLLLPIMEFQ
jgi:hypothetical protein